MFNFKLHSQILSKQITKRANHIPLSYIRGKTEFYTRELITDDNALEPRPESETIIELFKSLPKQDTVIDIGTGSGALIITAKLDRPSIKAMACDIDPNCLKVANKNKIKFDIDVDFKLGNLFEPYITYEFNNLIILANLPYVPNDFTINKAAMNEPRLAIFGGADGLDYYRELFKQLGQAKAENITVFCESLPSQHTKLNSIAKEHKYNLKKTDDFIQVFSRVN